MKLFLGDKEFFFENFDFNKRCKNKIEDKVLRFMA